MTISEVGKTYHGVDVIWNHYHIKCDTYLGLGRFAVIKIPCACTEFINAIYLPWYPYILTKDNPRYFSVIQFKYYPILEKYNILLMIDFIDIGTYE